MRRLGLLGAGDSLWLPDTLRAVAEKLNAAMPLNGPSESVEERTCKPDARGFPDADGDAERSIVPGCRHTVHF